MVPKHLYFEYFSFNRESGVCPIYQYKRQSDTFNTATVFYSKNGAIMGLNLCYTHLLS